MTDAQLNEYFSVRGLAVQFVYGKADLTGYPALEGIPASVDVTMYPSGTWSKGVMDVINLDAVYDATNLESNIYTASLHGQDSLVAAGVVDVPATDGDEYTHKLDVLYAEVARSRTARSNMISGLSREVRAAQIGLLRGEVV